MRRLAVVTGVGLQEPVIEALSIYRDKVGEENWLLQLAHKRLEIEE